MLIILVVFNYCILCDLVMLLWCLNLIIGVNGVGKFNVYWVLCLLVDSVCGEVILLLVCEGGLLLILWVGLEDISWVMCSGVQLIEGSVCWQLVNLCLGFVGEDFGYCIDFGLLELSQSKFGFDLVIKCECIWVGLFLCLVNVFVDCCGLLLCVCGGGGCWEVVVQYFVIFDSMLGVVVDL